MSSNAAGGNMLAAAVGPAQSFQRHRTETMAGISEFNALTHAQMAAGVGNKLGVPPMPGFFFINFFLVVRIKFVIICVLCFVFFW